MSLQCRSVHFLNRYWTCTDAWGSLKRSEQIFKETSMRDLFLYGPTALVALLLKLIYFYWPKEGLLALPKFRLSSKTLK